MVLLVPSELNPPLLLGAGTSALPRQMGWTPEWEGWNAHLPYTWLLSVARTRAVSTSLVCCCPSCLSMVPGSLLLPPPYSSQCQVSPGHTRLRPSLCPRLLGRVSRGYNLSLLAGCSPTAQQTAFHRAEGTFLGLVFIARTKAIVAG